MSEFEIRRIFFVLCLAFVFSTILVNSASNDRQWNFTEKQAAFRTAICAAKCQEQTKKCRERCADEWTRGKNTSEIDWFRYDERGKRIPEPANFNATLHCRDIDAIKIKHNPGIWVLEQRENSSLDHGIFRVQVNDKSIITSFANLSAGNLYRYTAYRVTKDGFISDPEESEWFQTFQLGHRSEEIKKIELTSQRVDELNPSRIRADIRFEPASDRSCHYDIISFTEDQGLSIGNLHSSQDFNLSLHELNYEANVSVFVSSKNKGYPSSSNNVSLTFVTSSCLDLRQNLTYCAPEEITGLQITEINKNESNYNVFLKWDEPRYKPDNYTIRIEPIDYTGETEIIPVLTIVLPGNASEAFLTIPADPDGLEDGQSIVSIIAESPGGTSLQAGIRVSFDANGPSAAARLTALNLEKTNSLGISIVAVSSVILVIILLVGAVWYGITRTQDPTKSNNSYNKRYKYCQSLNDVVKRRNNEPTFYIMDKNIKLEFEKNDPLLNPMIDKFEIHLAQLTIKDVLGSGVSGIVRLGSLRDSKNKTIDVAIKMLKDNPNADDLRNFHQEISIMKSAGQHQNIVSIIGCCTAKVTRPLLIVEYCSRGDLQSYLRTIWQDLVSRDIQRRRIGSHGNKFENVTYWLKAQNVAITNELYNIQEEQTRHEAEDKVTVVDLLSFARQVAAGMEFLSSNRVIHRDLAARNVLLCADKTAKISDFGLSRDIYEENVYKKQGNSRLPLKWMAIEALTHQIYTTQSDVWSFGILLWEIVTLGCNPYPETPTNMILQLLKSGYRMERPDNCGNELYNIMLSCWNSSPQRRPNFTQLKNNLEGLLKNASDHEYLNVYDLLRDSVADSHRQDESMKLIEKKNYTNIYSS